MSALKIAPAAPFSGVPSFSGCGCSMSWPCGNVRLRRSAKNGTLFQKECHFPYFDIDIETFFVISDKICHLQVDKCTQMRYDTFVQCSNKYCNCKF